MRVPTIAALAAYLSHSPVRLVVDLKDGLKFTGKRYPVYAKYQVEVDDTGEIQTMNTDFYQDCGFSQNDNPLYFTLRHYANIYDNSTWDYNTYTVTTDHMSNTFCRAPGSTESIAFIENLMDHIARVLNLDPLDVRKANMVKGDESIVDLMNDAEKNGDYKNRREDIQEFNRTNRWKKRGLAFVPMLYPYGVFGSHHGMISVFRDAAVQITSGYIEMGQGINTKLAQVVSHELGADMDLIKFVPMDTFTCPNDTVCGGNAGSDILAVVMKKCCKQINDRLAPVKKELGKKATWKEIVNAALDKNIDLHVTHMHINGDGEVPPYNIYGSSMSEVEVDILTGQYVLKRVDLVLDAGSPMSPTVDLGQAEGSFIMGLGYYMTENMVYSNTGQLKSNRTWNYKPPGAKDIPVDFRVRLKKTHSGEVTGMYRSKVTGEPPLCTSFSVPLAIHHALQSARKDAGKQNDWFNLDLPYSPEHIWLSSINNRTNYKL